MKKTVTLLKQVTVFFWRQLLLRDRPQALHNLTGEGQVPFPTQHQIAVADGCDKKYGLSIRGLHGEFRCLKTELQRKRFFIDDCEARSFPGVFLVVDEGREIVLRVPLIDRHVHPRRALGHHPSLCQVRRGQELNLRTAVANHHFIDSPIRRVVEGKAHGIINIGTRLKRGGREVALHPGGTEKGAR